MSEEQQKLLEQLFENRKQITNLMLEKKEIGAQIKQYQELEDKLLRLIKENM